MDDFAIDVAAGVEAVELAVRGELDLLTSADLQTVLDDACAQPGDVVVELSGVSFLDSTALRVLVAAHATLAADGRRLVLADPSPVVVRLLALSNLDAVLDVRSGRGTADGG